MAATKTMLTGGGFQDGEGNPLALGYLTMKLNQDASVSGVGNICSGIEITIQLDVNGNVVTSPAQSVWANTGGVLAPVNTFYKVTGYTAAGQRAWGLNNQQVGAGATFNLGSWVPNTVISWFPSVQTTTFEINGSPSSASSTLNLEAGNNITLTDEGGGTIQIAASGGGFNSDGAFIFGPGITDLPTVFGVGSSTVSPNTAAGATTPNQLTCYLFQLTNAFTLSKCTTQCFSNVAFGNTVTFGIYSFSGNKLIDGGQFLTLTAPGIVTNPFTPVTLPAGTYWFVQAGTSSFTAAFPGIAAIAGVGPTSLLAQFTTNTVRAAFAANQLSAGTLPATLGTLTPFTPSQANSDGFCTPLFE